jgi:Ca2+-transporting ATPase
MVLADDNFATIVAAVEEGRGVYANIRKTLQYLLAGNVGELALMMAALAAGLPAPLLPIHLLWINLVTDGLPALLLAADKAHPTLMRVPPRGRSASLTEPPLLWEMIWGGLLTGSASLVAFVFEWQRDGLEAGRNLAFFTLVVSEVLRSLAYRSQILPFWKCDRQGNIRLFALIAGLLGLQALLHTVPFLEPIFKTTEFSWESLSVGLALACIPLIVLESRKLLRTRGVTGEMRVAT